MEGDVSDFSHLLIYRLVVVLVGMIFGLFGYRLFCLGIYEKAGELKANWKGASLALRQAGPGTFFVLFGTIIISVDLFEPATIHTKTIDSPTTSLTAAHSENLPTQLQASEAKGSGKHSLTEIEPILAKLKAGQQLSKLEIEAISDLYLDEQSLRLGHVTDTESRTMLDNMK